MENVAHTLVGAVMAKAGLDRVTELAMPTCLIAANLPDIDALSGFWGSESYFRFHRSFTHSFAGICVLTVLLAWIVFMYDRKVRLKQNPNSPPTSFKGLLLVSFLGLLSHLALDYTNAYGVRPLLPWSGHWFYGDIAFIVDPWIWGILGLGLFFAIKMKTRAKLIASGTLLALVFYWIGLAVCHQIAVTRIANLETEDAFKPAVAYAAFPVLANPLKWQCVLETPDHIWEWNENLLSGKESRVMIEFSRLKVSAQAMRSIQSTEAGRVFLNFARIYQVTVAKTGEMTQVTLRDLRFNLRSIFVLDRNFNVQSARFLGRR